MKAEEKAKELVNRFYTSDKNLIMSRYDAKQCSLICVDEMVKVLWKIQHSICSDEIIYLEEVKQEIEKI